MLVWLNGTLIDRASASVSAFDAGLQHGIGLFETMSARSGRVFRALDHCRRLVESARALLLSDRLHAEPLAEAIELVRRRNELEEARLRLTVTGGNLNLLAHKSPAPIDPTILIDAQPPTVYPDAFFEQGVMVTIADGRINPYWPTAGHKTVDYWSRINALQHAALKKAGEALWFTVYGHLASGSVSNVFAVKGGALMTPPARGEESGDGLPAPVLPGITRAAILELAEGRDIPARRSRMVIDDLLGADEVFLTNSSWGVLPVVAIEKERVGAGTVGEVTGRLREAYLALEDDQVTG